MAALPLTTLPRLQAWCDTSGSPQPNALLQMAAILSSVSYTIAAEIGQDLGVDTWTERHRIGAGQRSLFVDNPKIQSVVSISFDPTGMFLSPSALTAGSDYSVDPEGSQINLMATFPTLFRSPCDNFQVVYQGGYAWDPVNTVYSATLANGAMQLGTVTLADGRSVTLTAWDSVANQITFQPVIGTFRKGEALLLGSGATLTLGAPIKESVINDHPSLEEACLIQAAYEWERRKSMGRTSTTLGGGNTQYTGECKLLEIVKAKISRYKFTPLRS